MTLDDLERQNRDFLMDFSGDFGLRHKIIHKAVPRYWHWWRGVVGNEVTLHRARLVLRWAGTAIGFRASREH